MCNLPNFLLALSLSIFCFLLPKNVEAQGPISGFLPPKGEMAVALSYGKEQFDTYFGPDGKESLELETRFYNFFFEHGLSEQMSMVASLPWMQTDEDNQGLQDGNLWIKYRNQRTDFQRHSSSFFTAVGLSLPIGNYTTGERASLGRRATVFQGRFVWQLDHQSGWFAHIQSGIDFQLVPEATAVWPIVVRAGYGAPYFYVEGWLSSVKSLNETLDNTLTTGAGSSWTRVGGTFYVPLRKWVGVHAGLAYILSGTNIGQSRRWNVGVVVKRIPGNN